MRLIIIGASGLIGSELFQLAKANKRNAIGTYNAKETSGLTRFDLCNQDITEVVPDISSKDTVYLLSAYSNPTWIFNNQKEAQRLNIEGTKTFIDTIASIGARLIFMSSVEVFDGTCGNYCESAVPNPLNLYGKMKFEIERYLQSMPSPTCIVRTGWNVGWQIRHRCVVSLTYKSLQGPSPKMANDNSFSISDVRDTAEGLLRIADEPDITHCHLASSPYLWRHELAQKVKQFSTNKAINDYDEVSFTQIPYTEPRARLNHIDNTFALSALSMQFSEPDVIIEKKVQLLDRYCSG